MQANNQRGTSGINGITHVAIAIMPKILVLEGKVSVET